jgi:hypothetical protein
MCICMDIELNVDGKASNIILQHHKQRVGFLPCHAQLNCQERLTSQTQTLTQYSLHTHKISRFGQYLGQTLGL